LPHARMELSAVMVLRTTTAVVLKVMQVCNILVLLLPMIFRLYMSILGTKIMTNATWVNGYLASIKVCQWIDLFNSYFWFHSGKNCEIDINECESSPCQYGGTCLERSNQSLYQQAGSQPAFFPDKFKYLSASG
jgi:hypothetical protein